MITEKISAHIVNSLKNNKVIENDKQDIYRYGFEILISSVFNLFIVIFLGCVFKCILASFFYFGMFILLRSFCGGYHADTYWQCNLIFLVVTTAVLFLFKFMPSKHFIVLHFCTDALSLLITCVYAPVENKNKSLSNKQKNIYHVISIVMIILFTFLSCLLILKFQNSYGILIDTTLLVVAVSMFVTDPKRGGEQVWTKK